MSPHHTAQDFFLCPHCSLPMKAELDYKVLCEQCGYKLEYLDGIWTDPALTQPQQDNYYEDIDYASRLSEPFSTTAREALQYTSHLSAICRDLGTDVRVLDVGCGDGRFTRLFLSEGIEHVTAVDLDRKNLYRTAARLTSSERGRTTLIQADIVHLPLERDTHQAVFAIGILNILLDRFTEIAGSLRDILAPGGVLVNSEPTLEGSLLYALVRHDYDEFRAVANTATKAVDYDGDRTKRYPVFKPGQIENLLVQSGFHLERTFGISVLPSLIFGGVLQMQPESEALKQELVGLVDRLAMDNFSVHRARMYLSRKK